VLSSEEEVSGTRVTTFIPYICWRTFKIKHIMKSYNNAEIGALKMRPK
jgi:hypothetical protein